jgi:enoyl-CoA hydratase/carnithine racemase
MQTTRGYIATTLQDHVATVEMRRPPYNFFDEPMLTDLADTLEELDAHDACRAIVLCSQGTAFCAGADFGTDSVTRDVADGTLNPIYEQALRVYACRKPIVAAVHGAAVGGGLGVALAADFRVTCHQARFAANFARLGIHPGFGLTVTLPRIVGMQTASLLMLTGKRIGGEEAVRIGLADVLVEQDEVRERALAMARDIAESAPLSLLSIRAALREGLVEQIRHAVTNESREQYRLFRTGDFKEGVAAMTERRTPSFKKQ